MERLDRAVSLWRLVTFDSYSLWDELRWHVYRDWSFETGQVLFDSLSEFFSVTEESLFVDSGVVSPRL